MTIDAKRAPSSGERLRNGTVSDRLYRRQIAAATCSCMTWRGRARQSSTAGSVTAVIRGGSTQTCKLLSRSTGRPMPVAARKKLYV